MVNKVTVRVCLYKAVDNPDADWEDHLIRWWTYKHSDEIYSHAELEIDGECYSTSPRDGEVRKKKINFKQGHWDFIEVPIKAEDINKILTFYAKTKGLNYDWAGIFGFLSPFSDREDKYFCSEWVTKALIIGGVKELYTLEPSKTSPNKLFRVLKGSGFKVVKG